jgi:hypothetical protein
VIETWKFTPAISMAAQPSPAPVILPVSGTYQSAQTVTIQAAGINQDTGIIQDAPSNAVIHYTLDGSEPISTSAVYTIPLTVPATSIVRAIAIVPGYAPSDTITVTYSN